MPDLESGRAVAARGAKNSREGRRHRFLTWLYYLCRFTLAAVFILAGALKLRDPQAFAQALSQYRLLPDAFLPVLAMGLPVVEVLAGVGLIFDLRDSLGAVTGMLVLFLAVLGYAIMNELDIDCGCFTLEEVAARVSVAQAFHRDLVLLAAALFLLWWRRVRDNRFLAAPKKYYNERRS